jgi:ABC-type multidrug transport system fused ATPase/permease subunit
VPASRALTTYRLNDLRRLAVYLRSRRGEMATLGGLEDIRANDAGAELRRGFWRQAARLLGAARRAAQLGVRWPAAAQGLASLGLVLALLAGAALYLAGQLSLGGAYLLVAYASMLGAPLMTIVLQFRGYPGSDRGVRGVDLRLTSGTVTVVTGRVGAGKSTLLKAILGLLPAQAGEIRWNDRPVADPAGFFVPPRTAHLPQAPRLFSGTLRENVLLGLDRDTGTVLDAIRAAARMIIRDPELMLIDDASNALDVDTERELRASLRSTGRTLLAVSHRPQLLTSADRLVVLDGGAVVAGLLFLPVVNAFPEPTWSTRYADRTGHQAGD